MNIIFKYLVALSKFTHNNNNKSSILNNFLESMMIQGS